MLRSMLPLADSKRSRRGSSNGADEMENALSSNWFAVVAYA